MTQPTYGPLKLIKYRYVKNVHPVMLGFEPMNFRQESPPVTTRPGLSPFFSILATKGIPNILI